MQKERSRIVKRPRFNWILFLPTRASDILFLDKGVVYVDHTLHAVARL